MKKSSIVIRMGAANWDAQVKDKEGNWVTFNIRKMDKRQRSDFHREFMNAFRATCA